MKQIATMKQIREIKRTEFLTKTFKEYKKADLVKTSSAFLVAGLSSTLIAPTLKNMITYSNEKEDPSLIGSLILGAAGLVSGVAVHKAQGKIRMTEKREEIGEDIDDLKDKFEDNLKNLNISYHNIFKSFVDDFETERSIYLNRYRALELAKEMEKAKPELEKVKKEHEELDNKEIELSKKIKELSDKEGEDTKEKEVGYEDVPSYPAGKTELEKTKEEFKIIREKLKEKEVELKEVTEKYDKIEREAKKIASKRDRLIEDDYPRVLANRESKKEFESFFIDGYKRLLTEIESVKKLGDTVLEVRFLQKRVKEIKNYDKFLETNFENFVKTYDQIMKFSTSTVGRIKNKSKERTYAQAPFWKIFQTFSNPQKHKASNEYIKEVNDIIEGANEDFFKEKEKLTWYLKRNYQEDWLMEIGDFSKEEAERLSELLKDYFVGDIGIDCDFFELKRSYREYLRDNHPDINEGVEDKNHEYSEVSHLVDKLKKYIDSRDKLFE
jgi:chromosome segregation ATPase